MNSEEKEALRESLLKRLEELGFKVNPHLHPPAGSKNSLKRIHEARRREVIEQYRERLEAVTPLIIDKYHGRVVEIEEIYPEIVPVERGTPLYEEFLWFSVLWWSLPHERAVGRVVRYMIYDRGNGLPMGLVTLMSPIMSVSARDKYLGICKEDRPYWVNQSLQGQRVGALPPYHRLGANRLVAMSLASSEVRRIYYDKYGSRKTWFPNRLLFVATFSAFGRSRMYEDLRYAGRNLSVFVGYTKGSGTFHLPDSVVRDMRKLLGRKAKKFRRSKKLFSISRALIELGLRDFEYHGVKRGVYIFPHVKNLREVIVEGEGPKWIKVPFDSMVKHWRRSLPSHSRVKVDLHSLVRDLKGPGIPQSFREPL